MVSCLRLKELTLYLIHTQETEESMGFLEH